jgi:hypothetical protein
MMMIWSAIARHKSLHIFSTQDVRSEKIHPSSADTVKQFSPRGPVSFSREVTSPISSRLCGV